MADAEGGDDVAARGERAVVKDVVIESVTENPG